MKTEIELGEFKGNPVITIHELDQSGNRKPYPLISVGIKKAKAIVHHLEDIEDFIDNNDRRRDERIN